MDTKSDEIKSIIIIGQGNVAWHYYRAMFDNGLNVRQISSRLDIDKEDINEDLVIIATIDSAIETLAQRLKGTNAIITHTSGSIDISVLKDYADNYGVIYPLQTLSKGKSLDFSSIPLCIEANNNKTLSSLLSFSKKLSKSVYEIDSSKRQRLHIGAVFACNFTNHLLGIAKEELKKSDIPFEILFPLIDQTIEKAKTNNPFDVQTGPAIREDTLVMEKHKQSLEKTERELYELLSKKIIEAKSRD